MDSLCDNGAYCDGVETCSATLGCQPGSVVSCPDADGLGCTTESCVESTDSCAITANSCGCSVDADCNDGNACNGVETCDA
jgi:hypothetical protein